MINEIRKYAEKMINSHGEYVEVVTVDDLQMMLTHVLNPLTLSWSDLDGHFGKSWVATIASMCANYFIWIDRETGQIKSAGIDRAHKNHSSLEEAKKWCQDDFEERVIGLFSPVDVTEVPEAP